MVVTNLTEYFLHRYRCCKVRVTLEYSVDLNYLFVAAFELYLIAGFLWSVIFNSVWLIRFCKIWCFPATVELSWNLSVAFISYWMILIVYNICKQIVSNFACQRESDCLCLATSQLKIVALIFTECADEANTQNLC